MNIHLDFYDWAVFAALATFLIPPVMRWWDRRRKA